MFRLIFSLFVALALLQAVSAIDILKHKIVQFVSNGTQKLGVVEGIYPGFIGDITVGKRSEHCELTSILELHVGNPWDTVESMNYNLSENNDVFDYVSVINIPGSYAVICYDPHNLGTTQNVISIRVLPNSTNIIIVTTITHC